MDSQKHARDSYGPKIQTYNTPNQVYRFTSMTLQCLWNDVATKQCGAGLLRWSGKRVIYWDTQQLLGTLRKEIFFQNMLRTANH